MRTLARTVALAALQLVACGDRDITACIARCQAFTAEPAVCQTLCTRSCPELQRSFGITEEACHRLKHGDNPPPQTPTAPEQAPLTARCHDFVAFVHTCGIGRPAPDPTVDAAIQRNNEIVLRQSLVAACERRDPPYDTALLNCFTAAAGDCEHYKNCADAAVAARPAAP